MWRKILRSFDGWRSSNLKFWKREKEKKFVFFFRRIFSKEKSQKICGVFKIVFYMTFLRRMLYITLFIEKAIFSVEFTRDSLEVI